MEMSQMYDEDLMENKFFQRLCDLCPFLLESAAQNGWMICIPKAGSFEAHVVTELDCMSHVLIHVEDTQYKTASDKHVEVKARMITLGKGFEDHKSIHILFSETFYTESNSKYLVSCVDQPLSFDLLSCPSSTSAGAEFRVQNVDDSEALLFGGGGSSLKKQVDKMIQLHQSALACGYSGSTPSLTHLIDAMHTLFTKVLQIAQKDTSLKRRLQQNKHLENNLKISVETYMHHSLYKPLFKCICTAEAADDSKLNKITRNLSQIQLRDLNISTDFSANIPRARRELLMFSKYSTPLAKMACVQRVVTALMQPPLSKSEYSPLTVDDLLPMLVFLIIRSAIPNWIANFSYMTKFHFSRSSQTEYAFHVSTLEAALEYVKSGVLNNLQYAADQPTKIAFPLTDKSTINSMSGVSGIDSLFELIRTDDLDGVSVLLQLDDQEDGSDRRLCHPLCSCDNCERLKQESCSKHSKVTVFSRDDRGYTACHQAAFYGSALMIEYLKKCGSVINATDYHGSTPLHIAAQKGHQGAVMMLTYCAADVNYCDNDGNRPLHLATANGHEECVKALLYQKESVRILDINAPNENGDTALHLAAKWSYDSITQLLLEHGAAPAARNRRKQTPMMLVSDVGIANLLSRAIERVLETAHSGFLPVDLSTSPLTSPLLSSVTSETVISKDQTPQLPRRIVSSKVKKLLRAVTDSDIEMVKHLLGFYDNMDPCPDYEGMELCHPLCQCPRCAPTQKMQSYSVNVNVADEQGKTPIHLATEKSDISMVNLLLQNHADVNVKTDFIQFTPLHVACQQLVPNGKIVNALIQHGAKINSKDCKGRAALHFSSQTGSTEITEILLKHGANVEITNVRGNTPLHEASKVNNLEIVELLLDYHANPTPLNKNGLTALQLTSDTKIVSLLTEAIEKYRYAQTTHPEVTTENASLTGSVHNALFVALEEENATKLQQLLDSIGSFRKSKLRPTTTVDKSIPFYNQQETQKCNFDLESSIDTVNDQLLSTDISESKLHDLVGGDGQRDILDKCISQHEIDIESCENSNTESADELY